ncbi:hypothetical protein [Mesorhizobium sp. M0768]|uniref:hypothetical protein n=1 Tax=Mesorhizobium sp. M0768 TaxID=2956996 RepID=UPI00333DA9C5
MNCEWNRRWIETNLFSDVFIPPCMNDTAQRSGPRRRDAVFHRPCEDQVEHSTRSTERTRHQFT